jgi:hypothetical protein
MSHFSNSKNFLPSIPPQSQPSKHSHKTKKNKIKNQTESLPTTSIIANIKEDLNATADLNPSYQSQTDRIIDLETGDIDAEMLDERDPHIDYHKPGIEDVGRPQIERDLEPDERSYDEGVSERPAYSPNESIE